MRQAILRLMAIGGLTCCLTFGGLLILNLGTARVYACAQAYADSHTVSYMPFHSEYYFDHEGVHDNGYNNNDHLNVYIVQHT